MMKKSLLATSAAILFAAALTTVADAQEASGFYLEGHAGIGIPSDTTFKDTNPSAANSLLGTTTLSASLDSSAIIGGALGYRISPIWRTALSLDYFTDIGMSAIGTRPGTSATSDVHSFVALGNAYLDFDGLLPNTFGPFQPYVVGGIGLAENSLDTVNATILNIPFSVSGSDQTQFAWTAGAGVGYQLTPAATIDLSYRYLDLGEMQSGSNATVLGRSIPVTGAKADLSANTITLGLRYAL